MEPETVPNNKYICKLSNDTGSDGSGNVLLEVENTELEDIDTDKEDQPEIHTPGQIQLDTPPETPANRLTRKATVLTFSLPEPTEITDPADEVGLTTTGKSTSFVLPELVVVERSPSRPSRRNSRRRSSASPWKIPRRLGDELENPHRDKVLHRLAMQLTCCSMFGMLLMIINMSLWESSGELWVIFLQVTVTASTILTVALIIHYYDTQRKFKESESNIFVVAGQPPFKFWKSQLPRDLLWEVLIHVFHPIPTQYDNTFSLICSLVMLLRVYLFVRIATIFSTGYSKRFEIFLSGHTHYNVNYGWQLATRVLFFRRTYTCFAVFTVFAWLACSFAIFFTERMANSEFDDVGTSVWFMYITFTTIGYGDFFPASTLGRFVTVVGGILGLIVANLFAAVLANKLNPTPAQAVVCHYLDHLEAREEYKVATAKLVQRWCRYYQGTKSQTKTARGMKYRTQCCFNRVGPLKEALDNVIRAKQTAESMGDSANDNGLAKIQEHVQTITQQLKLMEARFGRIIASMADEQRAATEFRKAQTAWAVEMEDQQEERHKENHEIQKWIQTQQAKFADMLSKQQTRLDSQLTAVSEQVKNVCSLQETSNLHHQRAATVNKEAKDTVQALKVELMEGQQQQHAKNEQHMQRQEAQVQAQHDSLKDQMKMYHQSFLDEIEDITKTSKDMHTMVLTQDSRIHSAIDTLSIVSSGIKTAQQSISQSVASLHHVDELVSRQSVLIERQKNMQSQEEERNAQMEVIINDLTKSIGCLQDDTKQQTHTLDTIIEKTLSKISDSEFHVVKQVADRNAVLESVVNNILSIVKSDSGKTSESIDTMNSSIEWICNTTNSYHNRLSEINSSLVGLSAVGATLSKLEQAASKQGTLLEWFYTTTKQFHGAIINIQAKTKECDTLPKILDHVLTRLSGFFARTSQLLNKNLRNHWYECNHWYDMKIEDPVVPVSAANVDPKVLLSRLHRLKTSLLKAKLENQHLIRYIKEIDVNKVQIEKFGKAVKCKHCGEDVYDDGFELYDTQEHALCSRALSMWTTHKGLVDADEEE